MTGTTLSHYRVLERLGEGGSAIVHKAEDLALGRPVALKILPPSTSLDLGRIARFQHEARTTSTLNHPNICTIYEIDEHEGRPFIAMEFLEGEPLSTLLAGRSMDCYRLVELATQIADGLDAAHAARVIHRDLKPANVYVTYRDHVKLLDFGLAVLLPATTGSRTPSSTAFLSDPGGTVPYMSPEQTLGEQLDTRSDLFSFGVVLYEMATGARPFTGSSSAALMDAIRQEQPFPARDLNTAVPDALDRIISKALEKNRKLRYQTASDMAADLRRLKRDLDTDGRPAVRVQAPVVPAVDASEVRAPAPHRAWAITQLLGAAAIGGALAVFGLPWTRIPVWHTPQEPQPITSPSATATATPAPSPEPATPPVPTAAATTAAATTPATASAPAAATPPAPRTDDRSRREPEASASPVPDTAGEQQLAVAQKQIGMRLYDQAFDSLQALVKSQPGSSAAPKAQLLMATIQDARGQRDNAIATYLDTATRYAQHAVAPEALYMMAGTLLQSRRRDRESEARRAYREIDERYPSSPWAPRALLALGQLEERTGARSTDPMSGRSVPAATIVYRDLSERYPRSPERELALRRLGELYVNAEQWDRAATTYSEIGGRYGSSTDDAWFRAAEIYEKKLKDPARARAAYAQVPAGSTRYDEAQRRIMRP